MVFYEVEFLGIPKIRFACSVDVEKLRNRFDYIKDFMEICLVEEGDILYKNFDGTEELHTGRRINAIFCDKGCDTSSFGKMRQRHTTVGVDVEYNLKKYRSDEITDMEQFKKSVEEKRTVLIPANQNIDEIHDTVLNLIKNISALHLSQNHGNEIQAIGKWFSLLGVLTNYVLDKLDNTHKKYPPSEYVYAQRTTQYISDNYKEKLTIELIAAYLGISEGHLHRTFKNVMGMGIINYLNQYRIKTAISLMENQNLSLREAAENVGIEDPAYMSRIFKKITGMSYRSFAQQKVNLVKKLDI